MDGEAVRAVVVPCPVVEIALSGRSQEAHAQGFCASEG